MANLFAILNLGSAHTDSTHNAWWDRLWSSPGCGVNTLPGLRCADGGERV